MKNSTLILLFTSLCLSFQGCAQTQTLTKNHPTQKQEKQARVIILATGGTIAGEGKSDTKAAYKAGEVPVDDLLKAVPEVNKKANVSGEQIANIGSQDMDTETWLKLSHRINEIFENDEADGVVITHGTDTMEETAYFLELTVNSSKPVVLVGAMRPATAMSQDGNKNLLDAVTVAASPESQEMGVMVAMNEYIYDARAIDKTNTTNTSAFQSRNFGPIGVVFDGKVSYYYTPIRGKGPTFDVKDFEVLPRVDIVYGHADAESQIIDFSVKSGALGIVYAGVGNGNFSASAQNSLHKAVEYGLQVVRASRIGSGRVTLENEIDDKSLGFIVADDLNPQKARILLMLALTKAADRDKIQEYFFTY